MFGSRLRSTMTTVSTGSSERHSIDRRVDRTRMPKQSSVPKSRQAIRNYSPQNTATCLFIGLIGDCQAFTGESFMGL